MDHPVALERFGAEIEQQGQAQAGRGQAVLSLGPVPGEQL